MQRWIKVAGLCFAGLLAGCGRPDSSIPGSTPAGLAWAALISGVAMAQPSTGEKDTSVDSAESAVEEVFVIGHPTLNGLREELRKAEDHVHELFNVLNDDDQYDIHCHFETRTGTKISQRVCKANFVDRATAVEAQSFLSFLRGEAGSTREPAVAVIEYKNGILREKLTGFVKDNAELREAVTHFGELRENYEKARQQVLESGE